ncbi:TPA: hypothetical protein ROG05_003639 [Enterobacter soli]|uniref:hypothetical protein n=1 Tax=Enterobacter sp. CP102 TaxID=2976431 RepID=UPI0022048904|nr:hypothetical protein [Enterobacter sp. CP102]UWM63213.1 hypothetical protein N1249_16880 [Enterobacter sp. CP102]HDX4051219.1 hypothetical protein [Enterobacter soli]
MKKSLLVILPFLLTGCVVDSKDSSNYQYVKYAQTFQKLDKTGRTDTAQRKEDLYSCGVERTANLDDGSYSGGSARRDQTLQEIVARNEKISSCMKAKGYTVYGYDECGPLKAPTGLCPN